MKAGFFTMPLHPPGSNITETLESDLKQLVKLDELGFAEAYIGEHFTFEWENIPVPDLLIAQALGMTENIRLGFPANLRSIIPRRASTLVGLSSNRTFPLSFIKILTIFFLFTSNSLPSAGKIKLIPLSKEIVVVTKKKTSNKKAISDIEDELISCIEVRRGFFSIIIFSLKLNLTT